MCDVFAAVDGAGGGADGGGGDGGGGGGAETAPTHRKIIKHFSPLISLTRLVLVCIVK